MFIVNTIILFEVIILTHELGHFLAAKFFKVHVREFAIGFGPTILKWGKGLTKYSLRLFPIGGYVAFKDEEKFSKVPILKRMIIILAGPLVNIFSAMFAIFAILLIQGKYSSLEVESVKSYCTQIKPNDEIIKVNNHKLLGANDFLFELSKIPPNEKVNLTVLRNKEKIEVEDVGQEVKTQEGLKKSIGLNLRVKKLNFLTAITKTFENFLFVLKLIFSSIFNMFTGKASLKDVSGPVGLFKTVGEAEKKGVCAVIFLFALLCVNIGMFNLLPFFALDGGQFLFLVYELIFKRPISKKMQNIFNAIGFTVLILMLVIVTFKDIFLILK